MVRCQNSGRGMASQTKACIMAKQPDPLPLKATIITEFQDRMGWTADEDDVSVEDDQSSEGEQSEVTSHAQIIHPQVPHSFNDNDSFCK